MEKLSLVITGSLDELAPPEKVRGYLSAWNKSAVLEIIEGADHFFWDRFKSLDSVLKKHL